LPITVIRFGPPVGAVAPERLGGARADGEDEENERGIALSGDGTAPVGLPLAPAGVVDW
jgi:hypothetical protein